MLTPDQLRQKYLDFLSDKVRQHAVVPSSPMVPENDPSTLFTGSGMQPMVPYLLGEKHPLGTRICDSQKCFRAEDIEEVGDNRHTTFFEMLGNWSLGDYFKKEQLSWFFEFLVKEVGLDPKKLYVTVFDGDENFKVLQKDGRQESLKPDLKSMEIWKKLFAAEGIEAKAVSNADRNGMQGGRIFYYPAEKNWWSRSGVPANMPVGEPGGPDSEVFYDFGVELKLHENSPFKDKVCHVNCDCGRFLEIGNSVFMEYVKTKKGFEPLPQKNVDFGGGFERILAASQNELDIFKTAIFTPIIQHIEIVANGNYESAGEEEKRSYRVIADHLRAAVMLAADGVYPSNKEQGYFARRLVRRAVRYAKMIGVEQAFIGDLVDVVAKMFEDAYPEVKNKKKQIREVLEKEEQKFRRTLEKGLKEFDKMFKLVFDETGDDEDAGPKLSAQEAFNLYETYGFPLELSIEEARQRGIGVPEKLEEEFDQLKQAHAEKSRTASAGMFKGGLQDQSEVTTKYHTTTHLLHAALRKVLGKHVEQKGSNITAKRMRFDFSHPQALTPEEKKKIEDQINDWIKADLSVTKKVMDKKKALKSGALAFFAKRYPDEVNVYSIGDDKIFVSKELCGGSHVEKTGKIGKVELFKEKSAAAGVRRLYLRLI